MKLLIVTQHFWPENFRINDFATDLVARGHDVTVLTSLPNYPKGKLFDGYSFVKGPYKQTWNGVKIIRSPIVTRGSKKGLRLIINYFSFAFLGSIIALMRLPRDFERIFVYQTSPVFMGIPAIVFKLVHKIPIYFWVLDLWPDTLVSLGIVNKDGRALKLLNIIVNWMYSKCDKILVPSNQIQVLLQTQIADKNKIEYFPQWAEDLFLQKDFCSDSENLVSKIIPKSGFNVLFSGNIGVAQDFETILQAAVILKDHTDINFVIVGDGHLKNYIAKEAKRLGVEKNFILRGAFPLELMPVIYKYSDALLVSLKKDPLFEMTVPSKVQAYMASGRPVIAALDGEGAEIIQRANCGMVAGSGNPEKLAECILHLKDMSQSEREMLGKNASSYYRTHFLKTKVIQQFQMMEFASDIPPNQKVAFIVNDTEFFLSHRLSLAKKCQEKLDILVVVPKSDKNHLIRKEGFRIAEYTLNKNGVNPIGDLVSVYKIFRILRKEKPQFIHNFTIKPALYGSLAGRWAGVPNIIVTITGLGYIYISNKPRNRILRVLVDRCYRWAMKTPKVRVIFQNPDDQNLFAEKEFIPLDRTTIIPGSGVDPEIFYPLPKVDKEEFKILVPCRMLWDKGVPDVVEAFQSLNLPSNYSLLLAGKVVPGNPSSIPMATLKKWTQTGNIKWLGFVEDMNKLYNDCDIVCLPSYREGLPLSLLEASLCEKPIVTTDVPGCNFLIRDNENGLLVPARSSQKLAQALKLLIDDSELRDRLARRARELTLKHYTCESINNSIMEFYFENATRQV